VAISFAVSNRQAVSIGFWPLPFVAQTQLYLVAFASLLFGFLAAELHAWIGRHRLKRELRRNTQEVEALRRELAATQARLGGAAAPPGTVVPPRS
jgi:hypothetical protein